MPMSLLLMLLMSGSMKNSGDTMGFQDMITTMQRLQSMRETIRGMNQAPSLIQSATTLPQLNNLPQLIEMFNGLSAREYQNT